MYFKAIEAIRVLILHRKNLCTDFLFEQDDADNKIEVIVSFFFHSLKQTRKAF